MSDGPFRSLNMTRRWKKAAELADNPAAALSEISLAVTSAIHQEWKSEISASLIEGIQNLLAQPSLFGENHFESLRQMAVGKPMANALLNYLGQAENTSHEMREMIVKAVTSAVIDRTGRAIRQIQEHCIRLSDTGHSFMVTSRIIQALQDIGYERLARKFLDTKSTLQSPISKTGLDDGVKI